MRWDPAHMSDDGTVPANKANMRRIVEDGVVAYSYDTGEEYSANPHDYYEAPDTWCMRDSNNNPMVLVKRVVTYVPATLGTP